MIEIILFFLAVSLTLYTVFGGADFGAGIMELFAPGRRTAAFQQMTYRAIGPVWEANHIWLILVIVLLFTAFPEGFRTISIVFHVPLSLMLIGIVLRGCAFTFRHYDPVKDNSQYYYSMIFSASSILTPLSQGVMAGAMILGDIPQNPESFQEAYIFPWFNLFCLTTGIFLCSLCALTASVFLFAERHPPEFTPLLRRAVHTLSAVSILFGSLVFAAAEFGGFPLFSYFFSTGATTVTLALAVILIVTLNAAVRTEAAPIVPRALIVALISLILIGWWFLQFPYLIGISQSGRHTLNLFQIAAPPAVLKQLVIALIAGSILIFPALFYLFHTFKFKEFPAE